ncbi:MAG TPA: glycerol-3-phosphate dehydrogenase C-terminal domain-containing protein, partial [Nocardioides sp.]|nr:glycerol-3-phosphate dehydrogenase C-terminal domain-containing protein [Nocardioides sp.]
YHALWNQRRTLASQAGLAINRVEHLLERYGSLVLQVLDLVAAEPELGEPLPGAEDYLQAEAVYAVTHEGARHLDDILTRRLRISIETFDRGVAAAPYVADLVRGHLGWDSAQHAREVEHYLKRVEAERESQRQPDDHTADAARKGAPDVVPVSQVAEAIEGAP